MRCLLRCASSSIASSSCFPVSVRAESYWEGAVLWPLRAAQRFWTWLTGYWSAFFSFKLMHACVAKIDTFVSALQIQTATAINHPIRPTNFFRGEGKRGRQGETLPLTCRFGVYLPCSVKAIKRLCAPNVPLTVYISVPCIDLPSPHYAI